MENTVHFYPNAQWVSINGNYTADELRAIADKIDNPELREVEKDGSKD